ncbi:flagellar basal body-associated protein FliL [Desulfosporosinus sp.]|uniref:flagellar basal body-associated FliL family protein n=1 Tax=Desulfosporosinus sp. TaxID=157907 RepID=UPI0025B7FAB7|nr:flagellar basal body-associated FliL family protein [Desulfosporosinus sp.]MBC2721918.1 flagellar basal body-associated FliL family protein [Desulfosporosinus sp.]MBC2728863.1 flagellar basal body-associated FliL family protein [Desulfosporosinus sp.]
MNRKTLIFVILALFLGVALGVGGTIGAQKVFFNTPVDSTKETAVKKTGPLLPIGEFTVNLQGGAFLKTAITVQVTDAKAGEHLKEEDAFLKDRVNSVLANKSLADVQTPDARETLRKELIERLNEVAENKIIDVLFLSFVYQ